MISQPTPTMLVLVSQPLVDEHNRPLDRLDLEGEISRLRERLADLIREAHRLPEKRAKSRLNRVGKEKRLQGKKLRGTVKAGRGKVRPD